ncbi:MAG: T9SS type A sorting domain-containing protein [Rhodothermaceae bacterium]|nr:T9SS type A sorting domain-containing protein [Rhodothermaceae bacterium]
MLNSLDLYAKTKTYRFALCMCIVFLFTLTTCIESAEAQQTKSPEGETISSPTEIEAFRLVPDGFFYELFGQSVSVSGNRLAIGDIEDTIGSGDGAVYIYVWNGSAWVEEQKIVPVDDAPFPNVIDFGTSVSLDGNYLAVGGQGDGRSNTSIGSAYIYKREGTSWTLQEKIIPEADIVFNFGNKISLRGDRLAVGTAVTGQVYLYAREGESWVQEAIIQPFNEPIAGPISFGVEDDYLVVGTPIDSTARIYKREDATWALETTLTPAPANQIAWEKSHFFGASVDIDGNTIIVGAANGPTYIYRRSGDAWIEQAQILPDFDEFSSYGFGNAVAIDGDYMVITNPFEFSFIQDTFSIVAGTIYVFQRSGTKWSQIARIIPPRERALGYGSNIALGGQYVITGAPNEGDNDPSLSGAVYGYILPEIETSGGTLSGNVSDVGIDPQGAWAYSPLNLGFIELFESDNFVSSSLISNGTFSLEIPDQNGRYTLELTATGTRPDLENPVTVGLQEDVTATDNLELIVPLSLASQYYIGIDSLEALDIKSDLLFGFAPPIPLIISYNLSEQKDQLATWLVDVNGPTGDVIEGMGHLVVVNSIAEDMYGYASEATHEAMISLLAIPEAYLRSKQVVENVAQVILDSGENVNNITLLDRALEKLLVDLLNMAAQEGASYLSPPYDKAVTEAVKVMLQVATRRSALAGFEGYGQEFLKDEFKNAIVTAGDNIFLSFVYVPETETVLLNASDVINTFGFTVDTQTGFLQTDPIFSQLEQANMKAINAAQELRKAGNLSGFASDLFSILAQVPTLISRAASVISDALLGFEIGFYLTSAWEAGEMVYDIQTSYLPAGINASLYNNTGGKTNPSDTFQVLPSASFSADQLHSYNQSVHQSVSDYEQLLDEISELIATDSKDMISDRVAALIESDKEVSRAVRIATAPIRATANEALKADSTLQEPFFQLGNATSRLFLSQTGFYVLLAGYLNSTDLPGADVVSYADSVKTILEHAENTISEATEAIASISATPLVLVTDFSVSPAEVKVGEPFTLRVEVTNASPLATDDVTLTLELSDGTTPTNNVEQVLGTLEAGASVSAEWTLTQLQQEEEEVVIGIDLSASNARTYSSTAVYSVAEEVTDTFTQSAPPIQRTSLGSNYPNPFTTSTTIPFSLEQEDQVSLTVYDMLGRTVTELINESRPAGEHEIIFTPEEGLSPGLYIYQLQTSTQTYSGHMVSVK